MNEFFDVVSGAREIDWGYDLEEDSDLVPRYRGMGAKKGDARICAQLHSAEIKWLISENRHFVAELPNLPFTVITAEEALKLLE